MSVLDHRAARQLVDATKSRIGSMNCFPASVPPLVEIAANRAGAAGYAIYQVHSTGTRELKFACGPPIPESGLAGFTMDSLPLQIDEGVNGLLIFVFRGSAIAPASRAVLERIAGAIEAVWRLSLLPETYARNAARIGELEFELADSKIADRARGLLADGATPSNAVDAIVRHVESVLRPGQLRTVLQQLTAEVEREITERELASRAKAALQSRYGMSEDQAHVHLRLQSRKARRRLIDVARQVLEEPLA
jgi:ANTAR domain